MSFIPHKVPRSVRRHKGPLVSKSQHILVVCDSGQAVSELPLADTGNYRFSYCAGDNRESELMRSRYPFDWILLDGKSLHGDQMELIRSLCTIGFFYPDIGMQGISGCQLEWNAQGVLELHCCMRAGSRKTSARQSGEDQDACIFEFHGPMKRTG